MDNPYRFVCSNCGEKVDFACDCVITSVPRTPLGTRVWQQEYLLEFIEHDISACDALAEYDLIADRLNGTASLMLEVARKHGTTVERMKQHWKCLKR